MKKPFIIIFLFALLSCVANAQNFKCLQHGPVHYFTNAEGYLRAMRIDSVRTVGTDTIYYPFHTARGNYCGWLDSNGASWLGGKVIEQASGTFLFDNMWNDTVIIKTQAQPGDTWMFFNDTSRIWYTATLTSLDTMSVYGSIDSVKTITISAYMNGLPNPTDPVNNFQIKLSQHNGFVQVFDLFTFPYHYSGMPSDGLPAFDYYLDKCTGEADGAFCAALSVYNMRVTPENGIFRLVLLHNPTKMEIHGANPGDMYQYYSSESHSSSGNSTLVLDSIVSKTVTPHSVTYGIKWREKRTSSSYSSSGPSTETTTYSSGLSSVTYDTTRFFDLEKLPEEYGQYNAYYYLPGRDYFPCPAPQYGKKGLYIDFSIGKVVFESWWGYYYRINYDEEIFAAGYGSIYRVYENYTGPGHQRTGRLVYAYKDGVTCGLFQSVGVEDVAASVEAPLTLYPNPAYTELNISSMPGEANVTIINTVGQRFHAAAHHGRDIKIDVSAWPAGLYFVKVDGQGTGKFVKQ